MSRPLAPFIQRVQLGTLEWVRVSNNEIKQINALKKEFHFHAIDLKETLPPLQRHKLVLRDDYIFMILLYPVFDRASRTIHTSEVDFFISPTRLVTVNKDQLPGIHRVFEAYQKTSLELTASNGICPVDDIAHLLYSLLSELIDDVFPMLIHLSEDIDSIETRLFKDYEKNLIQELLRIKTNVVDVRKTMQGHKKVISALIESAEPRFPIEQLRVYFERLIEQTKEIWDVLEVQRETVNALHETNASLIDFRINEIMKTLTVFSVIVFPLSLVAGIFGMNTIGMPIVDHPHGFWIIIGLMLTGTLGMLSIFKWKKWI